MKPAAEAEIITRRAIEVISPGVSWLSYRMAMLGNNPMLAEYLLKGETVDTIRRNEPTKHHQLASISLCGEKSSGREKSGDKAGLGTRILNFIFIFLTMSFAFFNGFRRIGSFIQLMPWVIRDEHHDDVIMKIAISY